MSALEPGLYRATVRGVPDTIVTVKPGVYATTYAVGRYDEDQHRDIKDAVPLIVLDLTDYLARTLALDLRQGRWGDIADQIEAQTKPPRIPEPAWGAIVEAHSLGAKGDRLRWVKGYEGWTNLDATGEFLNWIGWDCLIDPTLIREGVTS